MSPEIVVLVVVVAVVLLLAGAALLFRDRVRATWRTAALKRHFGPEYRYVLDQAGGREAGEAELQRRLTLRRELEVRDLDADEREQFATRWDQAQNNFVETPRTGLREADLLVQQVMRQRGFPVDHFSEREQMISVDHPDLVGHYRAAHAMAVADTRDDADTEELRQAVLDYRYLFDELIGAGRPESTQRGLRAS